MRPFRDTGTLFEQHTHTGLLLPRSVATDMLADGAVTSAKIANGTIATADLADAAVTAAKLAAAIPLGKLGRAQVTGDQGSITGELDLTNLTVTVTVAASRSIKVTGVIRALNSGANSNLLYIKESTTVLQTASYVASTVSEFLRAEIVLTPTAGSHTYKLTADTGGGTMTMKASTTAPAFILVEDIGSA